MTPQPGEITARAEPVGLANAGEFGCPTGKCVRPVGVQFFYDDPLKTPITDLEVQLADNSGTILVESSQTQAPLSRGLQDATQGVGALRPELGGIVYGAAPFSGGAANAVTNPSQDIESAADDAWELEQNIVGKLWDFEQAMTPVFKPYVKTWQEQGILSVPQAYRNGIMKGAKSWWDGEVGFWGSAWGVLKSSAAAVGGYVYDAVENGPIPTYLPQVAVANLGIKIGADVADWVGGLFSGVDIMEFLEDLSGLMRAFLFGDIDGIIAGFQKLTGLKDIGGAIGEFGQMIADTVANGIDTIRDMIEMVRRTPVLGLISSTFMRVLLMMTPNFWSEALGEGVGFIIPEVIIWVVTTLIAAISAGAGAAVLAARCVGIASKIRKAIKGGSAVAKLLKVMDKIAEIIGKIKTLGKKLRQSIAEKASGIMDITQRKFLPARVWRRKLDNLAHHGPGSHGVQRHEGDVTVRQLDERCMYGKDPMTGTRVDGVHGGNHGYGKDATKIKTPADFVRAYEKIIESRAYKAKVAEGKGAFAMLVPIEDALGRKWNARILGRTRTGSRNNPLGTIDTIFPDTTNIKAIFKKNADGTYYLYSMYPDIPK